MYRFQWLIVGEVSQLFWVLIRWRRWLSWANYERKFWCGKWSWVNQPSLHGEVDDNPSWDFFHTVQVIRWRTMKREMVGACHYFTIVNLHVAIAAHVVVVSFQLHYYVIRTMMMMEWWPWNWKNDMPSGFGILCIGLHLTESLVGSLQGNWIWLTNGYAANIASLFVNCELSSAKSKIDFNLNLIILTDCTSLQLLNFLKGN